MPQVIKYFVTGHTAKGYVDYLATNLAGIKNIVILIHADVHTATNLFNDVMTAYHQAYNLEIIYNPQGRKQIGGVIFREKALAFLSEAIVKEPLQGASYISIGNFTEESSEVKHTEKIYQAAYEAFKEGLDIHDKLEKLYIREMDFKQADQIAEKFIEDLLAGKEKKQRKSQVYRRLFGTNTPEGMVTCVEELLEPIGNVVYVKGRAGTGKSHFMKKVWQACAAYGYDLEIYHCSFDPESIDMVLVRELDFCMFDSTPPHEFFPKKDNDSIIDLYELTVTPGTDEKYARKIETINQAYKAKMKEGLHILSGLNTKRPSKKQDLTAVLTLIDQKIKEK